MIYAAQTKATDSAITVGAYNGKPLIPIRAFDNVRAMRAELERIWDGANGDNLIRVRRSDVVRWFGKAFTTREDGSVCSEGDE